VLENDIFSKFHKLLVDNPTTNQGFEKALNSKGF